MFNVHEYRRRPRQLADLLPWAGLIAPGEGLTLQVGSRPVLVRGRLLGIGG